MFTINKTQFLNLQEQVLKNKEDIAYHYSIDRVLADFGIRVIGRVDTYEEIATQPIPAGGYQYGDSYAVGPLNSTYDYYVYTRPFEGETANQWFNIGALQIEGPVGPEGPQGPKGETGASTRWYTISSFSELSQEPYKSMAAGNIAIIDNTNWETGEVDPLQGQTYIKGQYSWQSGPSLMGPQGIQGDTGPQGKKGDKGDRGEQGEPGPAGPIVQLQGIITSMSQLDGIDPTTLPPNYAYLLEQNGNRYIIGIVADEWTNLGIFSGGTLVYKDGIIQNEWNADSKLDKITSSGALRLYGINSNGGEWTPTLRPDPQTTVTAYKNQPVMYDITSGSNKNNGLIRIAETPIERYHTASKAYVDNAFKVYKHNITFTCEVNDYESNANVLITLYDGGQAPKGYLNTNGEVGVSGVYNYAGTQYAIISADINTNEDHIYVQYKDEYGVSDILFDSGTWNISDTVTRII